MKNAVFFSEYSDPVYNLAMEQALFTNVGEGCTLFLRKSAPCVSLGVNQNAWKACRFSLLEQEGAMLLRRYSGGGAMYGDEGALAFSFITPSELYDEQRQMQTLLSAIQSLGVEVGLKNGALFSKHDNKPLSAHAKRHSDAAAMHHGLIYVHSSLKRMARYIAPPAKAGLYETHANISDYARGLNTQRMKRALTEAFIRQFGPARMGKLQSRDNELIAIQSRRLASEDWRFLTDTRHELSMEHRFAFGNIELQFHILDGLAVGVNAYSDAMDTAFVSAIAHSLKGCAFKASELSNRLNRLPYEPCVHITKWLQAMGF